MKFVARASRHSAGVIRCEIDVIQAIIETARVHSPLKWPAREHIGRMRSEVDDVVAAKSRKRQDRFAG